jgi:hypothetical protein
LAVPGVKRQALFPDTNVLNTDVRENGKWLIAKRQSTFAWRDHAELGQ